MDTSSWKWFRYDEIFDINSFRGETLQDLKEGDIPYISTTEDNNGIIGHIEATSFCNGNKITVSRNGSVGISFYQPNKFYPSPDDIRIFTLRDNVLNPYIGLFLCVLIEKERYRYTYGRKFGTNRMKASLIKLPVTPDGTPDWQYMETFVKDQIIPQLPKKAQKVWLKKYDTKPLQEAKMELNTDEWKWFRYDEIFDIKHGFYNKKPEDNPEGDIPFIGATDSNNGVTSHSDLETIAATSQTGEGYNAPLEDKIFKANCVTVSNDGSVGFAFYQNTEFTCSHSVNPLYLKGHEINPYIALFLCTLIEKERFRWAYGRKWRPIRMPSSKIKLPVTSEGTPDWQFMEDYIKSLPYSKNLELSDKDEPVDELMEYKKKVLELEHQLQESQKSAQIINYGTINNDNSKHITIK